MQTRTSAVRSSWTPFEQNRDPVTLLEVALEQLSKGVYLCSPFKRKDVRLERVEDSQRQIPDSYLTMSRTTVTEGLVPHKVWIQCTLDTLLFRLDALYTFSLYHVSTHYLTRQKKRKILTLSYEHFNGKNGKIHILSHCNSYKCNNVLQWSQIGVLRKVGRFDSEK